MTTESTTRPRQPRTPAELLEAPIEAGDMAIDVRTDTWYIVLETLDAPAGEVEIDPGGTVAEWEGCDPDAEVVEAVALDEIQDTANAWDSVADVRDAVARGRIHARALPESDLAPALEEFGEARRAGEWDGLEAYIKEVRR